MTKPLNLDKVLGVPKNRVVRMGVELEGGWKAMPQGIVVPERDTSVFKNPATEQQEPPPGINPQYVGEIPIGPIEVAVMPKFMKKYYPHKVDKTCGMHVHQSVANALHYGWLMEPEYQETMIHYLSKWAEKEGFPKGHHIWERLEGKTVYCQKKYWPELQYNYKQKDHNQQREGHRYTIVNYSGRVNTIEVRVLPMMETVAQAIRAVRMVIDITNASLAVLSRQDKGKLTAKLEMEVFDDIEEMEVNL
jgi:hypothetical protein